MRRLKLYLIFSLLLTFIPKLHADSSFEIDGITYEYRPEDSDYFYVIQGDSPYSGDIEIPAEVEFSGVRKTVKIGAQAFRNCTGLTSIILPEYIIIEERAFQNCTGLKTLTLSKYIDIGERAFQNCTALTTLSFPRDIVVRERAFENCTALSKLDFEFGISLYDYTFKGCVNLKEVEAIGMVYLGKYSFDGCSALEKVKLPRTQEIPEGTFDNCTSLKYANLEIPRLNAIYPAFNNSLIDDIVVLNSKIEYKRIENQRGGPFQGSGIISFEYGDMTEVPAYVFYDCDRLTDVIIPATIDNLGKDCFAYCESLENVTIESSKKILSVETTNNHISTFNRPFRNSNVKNIALNRQISGPLVQYNSDNDEESISSVDVNYTYGPEFKRFPSYFLSGALLTKFYCPPSVQRIMSNAFSYNNFEEIIIPANLDSIGLNAFYRSDDNLIAKRLVIEQSKNPICISIYNLEGRLNYHASPFAGYEFEYVEFNRPCEVLATAGNAYYNVSPFYRIRIKEVKAIEGSKTYDMSIFLSAVIIYMDLAESIEEIVMPTAVFNYGDYNNIFNLIVRNPVPPKFNGEGTFSKKLNVYVPDSSVEAYKSDAKWGRYNILPLSEFSTEAMDDKWAGVESIDVDDSDVIYSINDGIVEVNGSYSGAYELYTLSGQLIYRGKDDYQLPAKGIYILKSGQTAHKIIY